MSTLVLLMEMLEEISSMESLRKMESTKMLRKMELMEMLWKKVTRRDIRMNALIAGQVSTLAMVTTFTSRSAHAHSGVLTRSGTLHFEICVSLCESVAIHSLP